VDVLLSTQQPKQPWIIRRTRPALAVTPVLSRWKVATWTFMEVEDPTWSRRRPLSWTTQNTRSCNRWSLRWLRGRKVDWRRLHRCPWRQCCPRQAWLTTTTHLQTPSLIKTPCLRTTKLMSSSKRSRGRIWWGRKRYWLGSEDSRRWGRSSG